MPFALRLRAAVQQESCVDHQRTCSESFDEVLSDGHWPYRYLAKLQPTMRTAHESVWGVEKGIRRL
jgi:hypothetical protein